MPNKDILEKDLLERIRTELFKCVRGAISSQSTVDPASLLQNALHRILGGNTYHILDVIQTLKNDESYKVFEAEVLSFNTDNIGAVEAYFFDRERFETVHDVISKIFVGMVAFAAIGAIAASGIAGPALIPVAGIAAAYLCASVVHTAYGDAGLIQSLDLRTIDKPMMVAIKPFTLLLDKCADIIAEQIFNRKVQNLDKIAQSVAVLTPQYYFGKSTDQIAEDKEFFLCNTRISAKKFALANIGQHKTTPLTQDEVQGKTFIFLLENYSLDSIVEHMKRDAKWLEHQQREAISTLSTELKRVQEQAGQRGM